ncbi:MAG: helix-turn-helix transcriptional regulator [Clostridia bacterium]|nr:helix-turn-helix transcriptional regulator [Clostridia bacterium]
MIHSKYDKRYKEIGRKIAKYRSEQGYIQETFANALGVSYSYIAQIEAPNQAKRMSLELLFEIAELLNIDVKDLL